jgi:hypothetical protein
MVGAGRMSQSNSSFAVPVPEPDETQVPAVAAVQPDLIHRFDQISAHSYNPWVVLKRFGPNLALAYILVGIAGWFFHSGDPFFEGVRYHPYLVIIIWSALRYGWKEALVASLVASLLNVVGQAYHTGLSVEGMENDDYSCFLFVSTALGIGILAEARRKQLQKLRLLTASQATKLARLEENCAILEYANRELREHAQEVDTGLSVVHQISGRLLSLTTEQEVYAALIDVLSDFLGADRCSYYAKEGQDLRLMTHYGWPTVPHDARLVRPGTDLIQQAVEKKCIQTVKEYPPERFETGQPSSNDDSMLRLMAAPVLHPTLGAVLGVLSIESLPFINFTRANSMLLVSIASLAGKALAQVRQYRPGMTEEDMESDDFLGYSDFQRRLRMEMVGRKRGARPPFTVIGLKCLGLKEVDPNLFICLERAIALLGRVNLRAGDIRARLSDGQFAFLVLDAHDTIVDSILRELARQLNRYLSRWFPEFVSVQFLMGTASGEQSHDPQELLDDLLRSLTPSVLLVTGTPSVIEPELNESSLDDVLKSYDLAGDGKILEAMVPLERAIANEPQNLELRGSLIRLCLIAGGPEQVRRASQEVGILALADRLQAQAGKETIDS